MKWIELDWAKQKTKESLNYTVEERKKALKKKFPIFSTKLCIHCLDAATMWSLIETIDSKPLFLFCEFRLPHRKKNDNKQMTELYR